MLKNLARMLLRMLGWRTQQRVLELRARLVTGLRKRVGDPRFDYSLREVRATAKAYSTEPEFFSDLGHNMMLEPGWQSVAERIHTWLGTRGL